MGYNATRFMVGQGAKLIGVVGRDGSIYNLEGINPQELFEFKASKKSILGFPKAESYNDDCAFYRSCDILIPAAVEKSINKYSEEVKLFT